ncbi:hypothetical protein GIS00_06175 [Nakamurella sp. YIM 132087]|uniref:YCII-related domain-containing protein n=1 Tax=Nakamurella alba TaxID=2665158 RepID=A0A7K1FHH7_9ACTN|nr:YciI family protein [Nakamurella alba]MTD13530.1 hypothetical protein [Nakamurella alba]
MPVFAVIYRYTDNTEALTEHRPAHRVFLNETDHGDVEFLVTGPFADGAPGALIVVSGPDLAAVTATMDEDPFAVQGGIIAEREIREWTQVKSPWI